MFVRWPTGWIRSQGPRRRLPPGTVRTNSPVRRISRNGPASPWLVEPLDGPPLEADAVIVATEAHATARLIDIGRPGTGSSTACDPLCVIADRQIAYRRDQVSIRWTALASWCRRPRADRSWPLILKRKFPDGAGRYVPAACLLGGATHPELFDLDDSALSELVASRAAA